MRGRIAGPLVFCALLAVVAACPAAERSKVSLERLDKAILVPSAELGEVTVYADASQTSSGTNRYRYTYRVHYREAFPGVFPFTPYEAEDPVPLVGLEVTGDPDCDVTAVATPSVRTYGPWRWYGPRPGMVAYTTTSRRWMPTHQEVVFRFTSACAPGAGRVTVRMTHEEQDAETHGVSARILAPAKPPARPRTSGAKNAPSSRGSYAHPPNRR